MLFGVPFLLNPPAPKAPEWHIPEWAMHLLHNSSFLHALETSLHCAYFGLILVDSFIGTKFYIWTALPLLILTLMHFKGD